MNLEYLRLSRSTISFTLFQRDGISASHILLCWSMTCKTSLLYKPAQGDFPILLSPLPCFLFVPSTLNSSPQPYSQRTLNVMENFHDIILIIFSMSNNRHVIPIWETIYMHIKKAERVYIKYYQQAILGRFCYRWLLFSCLCFLCFPINRKCISTIKIDQNVYNNCYANVPFLKIAQFSNSLEFAMKQKIKEIVAFIARLLRFGASQVRCPLLLKMKDENGIHFH